MNGALLVESGKGRGPFGLAKPEQWHVAFGEVEPPQEVGVLSTRKLARAFTAFGTRSVARQLRGELCVRLTRAAIEVPERLDGTRQRLDPCRAIDDDLVVTRVRSHPGVRATDCGVLLDELSQVLWTPRAHLLATAPSEAALTPAVDQATVGVAPVWGITTPRHARGTRGWACRTAIRCTVVDRTVIAVCAEQPYSVGPKDDATIERIDGDYVAIRSIGAVHSCIGYRRRDPITPR